MDLSRVRKGEWIAIAGGLLLAISLFLKWYDIKQNFEINGQMGPISLTGWETHSLMRWLLLAAAVAPLILAYIIARDHALSWPRGQVTSVVAIAAIGLLVYNGVIDQPAGSSTGLKWGWLVGLIGALLMLVGSVIRQNESEIRRKPPGVL